MAILLKDSTEYISDIIIDWQRTFEWIEWTKQQKKEDI